MVQNQSETKLIGKPEHRHDVIGPVGVVMDHTLAFECFDERFQTKISRWGFTPIGHGLKITLILLRFQIFLTHQRRGL